MSHISFSELKNWNDCPFKHKLVYVDKIKKFVGNEYTAFGKAIHDTCEKMILSETVVPNLSTFFDLQFLDELQRLKEENIELKQNLINDMREQGSSLTNFILPAVKETFVEYEVISAEEALYEDIENSEFKFKGYIDLVLKTKDGKYHIIDWKTCSWGWDRKRKADRMTTYQLTLYKYYFAKKHNVDLSNIETHFALLKRTAKKNKVEIFRVTSGPKKTENAVNLLNKALYNIEHKKYIKNRLSCTQGYGCEFYKTEHCR